MSRRGLAVAAAAVVLAAARLLAGAAPSDEERIRALFEDAARAAEEKRVGDAVEALAGPPDLAPAPGEAR
jgi:hypothetical protein